MRIVLNAESLGYSEKAIDTWEKKSYAYRPSSWKEIMEQTGFPAVEILIVRLARKVDKNVLQRFPDLKSIVSATTGHDHIDLTALEEYGIKLVSLRGHNEFLKTIPSTAEHTWALLLSLVRYIPIANEHVKSGGWNRDLFRGIQLQNKTFGIVGYGRTGKKVAEYARVFGMRIIFYDPYISTDSTEQIDTLDSLMQQSDIVSFHVHLNEETTHLLSKKNIHYVKQGAYLLNTSRGRIWDEQTVADALQKELIKGVAVDVLENELDDLQQSPLRQAQSQGKNVIITPHIGGATWDAMWACEEFLANKIEY